MKNLKKSHAAIAILSSFVALAAAAQFTISLAGPTAEPPEGNIIPTFNGVNITPVAGDSSPGLSVTSTNGRVLNIDPLWAQISDTSILPVIFSDTQGISLANGGSISAYLQDIKFTDFFTSNSRIDAQIPIINTSGIAPTDNPVLIADSAGLALAGTGSTMATTPALLINGATGGISNPQTGKAVTIADPEGLQTANGTGGTSLTIRGSDGFINAPGSSVAVTVMDNEGFRVTDNSGSTNSVRFDVNGLTGAISNPYSGSNPVTISDDAYVSGKVGIGTGAAAVVGKLDVATATGTDGIVLHNSSLTGRGWDFYPVTNGTNTDMRLYEFSGASGDRVTFQSGGNVGIGITSPTSKLEVNGSASFTPGGTGGRINLGSPWGQTGMTILNTNRADLRFDDSTVKLVAGTGTSYPPEANGIAITTAGNVGVGTTSPASKFEVAAGNEVRFPAASSETTHFNYLPDGKNYIRGTTIMADLSGNVGIGTASPTVQLHVEPNASQAAIAVGRYTGYPNITSTSGDTYLIMDSTGSAAALNWYSADDVILANGGGNVGVGTNDPGARLDVRGTGDTRIRVGSSAVSSYTGFELFDSTADNFRGGIFLPNNDKTRVSLWSNTTEVLSAQGSRIGINDTSPDYTLDVVGNAAVSGHLQAGSFGGVPGGYWGTGYATPGASVTVIAGCTTGYAVGCTVKTGTRNTITGNCSDWYHEGPAADLYTLMSLKQDYWNGECKATVTGGNSAARCVVITASCLDPAL